MSTPCESVEYVLPLVSGFTIDEEEAVKEALASELHRILWYFFSTCRVYVEGEEDSEHLSTEVENGSPAQAYRSSSSGQNRGSASGSTGSGATKDSKRSGEDAEPRRPSLAETLVGSSLGSNLRLANTSMLDRDQVDTPGTQVSDSAASDDTAFSQVDFVDPFSNGKTDGEMSMDVGALHPLPPLQTNFFTPLLGALLLNSNPTISEMCRSCIIKIIARLRRKTPAVPVEWGGQEEQQGANQDRRTFPSQSGPHSHIIQGLDQWSRDAVEAELMRGIVIGMGSLDTEMPDDLLPTMDNEMTQEEQDAAALEIEVFKDQLLAEALAGRATSMNLIGALCEFYTGEEAVERGFAEEIIRCPDGDPTVRAEGAVALQAFAMIAPANQIDSLVSLVLDSQMSFADSLH